MRYNPPRKKNKLITYECLTCGAPSSYYRGRGPEKKYCSNKCQMDYKFLTVEIPKILTGTAGKPPVRRWLIKTRGNKCEICGITEWQSKPITLQFDHVDGNSDNNDLNNVRLLCPNCHSQTPTFSGRNTKNSIRQKYMRKWRMGHGPDEKAGALHASIEQV